MSHMDPAGPGRASAPPAAQQQNVRPGMGQGHGHAAAPSPGPAAAGAPRPGGAGRPAGNAAAHPDGKTMGQGPATFEEMGIPQGKNEGDCVSFFLLSVESGWKCDGVMLT
jgi:hypothetical protein